MIALRPNDNRLVFQSRQEKGETCQNIINTYFTMPCWIKLKRESTLFSCYASTDGDQWQFIEETYLNMNNNIYVGLAVTGSELYEQNTSMFEDVNFTPDSCIISGKFYYYSNEYPINNVTININNVNTFKSAQENGQYKITLVRGENYIITPFKSFEEDINFNTILTYDAALVARHAVGLDQLNSNQQIAADVDLNNSILTYDAALIARYAVGLQNLNGAHVGNWIFIPNYRSYNKLNENITNQNYIGIFLGDVDGNW